MTTKTIWNIDTAHSEIQFKVKHMMIASVTGKFENFSATATTDGDSLENAEIQFSAQTNSVNTNSNDRDNHLKSADFFDSEKFPELKFETTKVTPNAITGNLTVKDVTKPVTLDLDFGGTGIDPWGGTRMGFGLSGKINRKDFGLTWNAALETGGVLVSDDVKLIGEIQLVKQK